MTPSGGGANSAEVASGGGRGGVGDDLDAGAGEDFCAAGKAGDALGVHLEPLAGDGGCAEAGAFGGRVGGEAVGEGGDGLDAGAELGLFAFELGEA